MDDTQKEQTQRYIDKHGITLGALADRAGIGRWSLKKWMASETATMTIKTWAKLATYMAMNA